MIKRRFNIITWATEHYTIVFLLVVLLFGFGIIAFNVMPKQEFPDYTIRQGVVVGVFPGATAEEVEEQLAKPLERFLFTYPEVKRNYTTTTSQNGYCYAMVELNDNVRNKDEVWSKIKHGLTTFKSTTLPSGVLALVVQDDFGDTSALLLAIESDSRSYSELEQYIEELEDKLRRVPSVANMSITGMREEQVSIYVDREKLTRYGVSDNLLTTQLVLQSNTLGGNVINDEVKVPVHLSSSFNNIDEIANHILFSDGAGNSVRVKDIARVEKEYPESSFTSYNGEPCLVLSIEMRKGYNIVAFGKDVQEVIDDYVTNELPTDVSVNVITNQSSVVDDSVKSFMRDLILAIIIIIIVMMILFPMRTAIVAAVVVPLNTFISIGIMYLFGIPLHTITFAALIVSMGMIVDNSIVIIDGYVYEINNGVNPKFAATKSARMYFMPMFLATICICIIFYPILFFFKGQLYEFTCYFPLTITINLMISLVLAVLVIPILEVAIIKPTDKNSEKVAITQRIHAVYVKLLNVVFRHAWFSLGVGAVLFIIGVLLLPTLKFRMQPVAERDQFAVEIYLPAGTPLNTTAAVADSLRVMLSKDERVKSVTSFIGMSSPRFHLSYAPQMPSDSYAQFIVNTGSPDETEAVLDEYTNYYAHYFSNAYIRFKQIDFQHVPSFEYRFYGDDATSLKKAAELFAEEMRKIPELTNIHTDWGTMSPYLDVNLDQVLSAQLGISRFSVGANMMMATSGVPAGSIWEQGKELPIVIKSDYKDKTITLDDVSGSYVSTMIPGVSVPLRQVASVDPVWGETQIVHRNGVRTLTITADMIRGADQTSITSQLKHAVEQNVLPKIDSRTTYQVGGVPEYNKDNLMPIIYIIVCAVFLVFFFLLFTFGKFGLTFGALISIFFFLFGMSFGLKVTGLTVGITGLLGLIGILGMTVRNVILMFQHADEKCNIDNMSPRDAAYDAGVRRMTPIFLTTSTSAFGVIPMIISGSSFWAPVGVVIFAGGLCSLLLTITLMPLLYWKMNRKKSAPDTQGIER